MDESESNGTGLHCDATQLLILPAVKVTQLEKRDRTC